MEDLESRGGSNFEQFLLKFGATPLAVATEEHHDLGGPCSETVTLLSPFGVQISMDDIIPMELTPSPLEDNQLSVSSESPGLDNILSLPPAKKRGRPRKPRREIPPRVKAYQLPPTTKSIRNAITAKKNRTLAKEREKAKDDKISRLRDTVEKQAAEISRYKKRLCNILENVLNC